MSKRRVAVWTVGFVLAALSSTAQPPQRPDAVRPSGARDAASAALVPPAAQAITVPLPEEKVATTSHSVRVDGREIRYTATTGRLPVRDERGKLVAHMFFVAYTRDGDQDLRTRPIAFLYNGGPGSASVWLHMGSFGPRRVQMADDGFQPAPPFRLVENEYSLLGVSDLVFIDAIDTGYSRPAAGENPAQFHGVRADIQAFGEAIRTYLGRYNRWASPKYLIGESYGTMRSAGLSGELQQSHGIELNGIVLISSVLDYLTKGYAPGNDLPYVIFLPSYTATAWYHKKLPPELQGELKKAVDEARAFANGEYLLALAKGNRLTDVERADIAKKVARLTGLSPSYVERCNLRVSDQRFRVELLRDRRLMVGRLDARFTGYDADAAVEQQEFDPSNTAIQGAYTALFNDYVRSDLKWESDLQYPTSGNVRPWSYDDFQNRYLNLVDTLRTTMARNPHLRVFVANGYYDFATPFGGTEHTFAHLGYEPTYAKRIELAYYEAGHMMYIRPVAHKQLQADVARFITSTAGGRQ